MKEQHTSEMLQVPVEPRSLKCWGVYIGGTTLLRCAGALQVFESERDARSSLGAYSEIVNGRGITVRPLLLIECEDAP